MHLSLPIANALAGGSRAMVRRSADPRHSSEPKVDEERLQKHCDEFAAQLRKAKVKFDRRFESEEFQESGKYEDFTLLRTLSKGAYGTVILTTLTSEPTEGLAMKIMEKKLLIKKRCVRQVLSEIRILDAVDFTFLVRLHYFFKDNVYLFLVMPFINGGDMFMLLQTVRKFDEARTKFYASQVTIYLILCLIFPY